MIDPSTAFAPLPVGLREPLLEEYRAIIQHYAERRWGPSELSGGRFCEIVYTILHAFPVGNYPSAPSKPPNFLTACRQLEGQTNVPRSFQILIPRMLPALYEVRNQRGVGHVGGDVDPNQMDAAVVVSMCSWIMSELVRVLHMLSTQDAQMLVDMLSERQVPLVWQSEGIKRVLDPDLSLHDHALILLAASPIPVAIDTLREWALCQNKSYFKKLINQMVRSRYIYLSPNRNAQILPPGSTYISHIIARKVMKA